MRETGVIDVPLAQVTVGPKLVDPADPLLHTARGLGIHMGEQRLRPRG